MSEQTREFSLATLYTVSSGKMVTPDGVDGLSAALGFLTGDEIYTHQLGLAHDAVVGPLLEQLPFLGEIEFDLTFAADETNEAKQARINAWMDIQNHKYGEFHTVHAVPEAWGEHDPMEDLFIMMGGHRAEEVEQ